ncbi:MAG TPA: MnhB domain-containing protein [Phycisphaerae bacterium]|nr:MnhB domain-containing protein [Phycisphaerae bacterium]
MRRVSRLTVFFAGELGLAALLTAAALHEPGPTSERDRYRVATTAPSVDLRQVTDAVSAVNFDFRGIDTLGEEFILFVSVSGVLVLLREPEAEERGLIIDAADAGRDMKPTSAMRGWMVGTVGPKVLFGLYIVGHGALSPGGGFQGGVILATAPMIIYLADGFKVFRRIVKFRMVEIAEAAGATAFLVLGLLGILAGREYLTNVLPLGEANTASSGGTVVAISWATGIEVCAGFVLVMYAFLQHVLAKREAAE